MSPLNWTLGPNVGDLRKAVLPIPSAAELAELQALLPAASTSRAPAEAECTIFTLWEYAPDRVPYFVKMNLLSWQKHAHGLCKGPVLINDTNVKEYIPDMPQEYFSLPYVAAKSDMIRYALLYFHGGIYMDSDFLVVKDLTDLITRLPKYDFISYESSGQSCRSKGSFSSNFMGGRKGSIVHKEIWEAQKNALTNHCDPSEMKLEKVCCLDDLRVKCHIPWTQLGEGVSHQSLSRLLWRRPKDVKLFCFAGQESFVPGELNHVFLSKPKLVDAMAFWRTKKEKRPLDRIAYHLFNSNIDFAWMGRKELFDTKTVIGMLYNRSFSDTPEEGPSSVQLLKAEMGNSRFASRIDKALQTSLLPEECRGLHRVEQSGPTGSGGAFQWCKAVLGSGAGLEAIAFGVSAQDAWASELAGTFHIPVKLEDCSSGEGAAAAGAPITCSPGTGAAARRAVLAQRLAARGPRSVVLRLELGGGEWDLLADLTEEELGKIALLDLRAQLCAGGARSAAALEPRVQSLERLARLMEPAAAPGAKGEAPFGVEVCGPRGRAGEDPASRSLGISYVSRQSLIQVRAAAGADLVDRIDRATRPSVTPEECRGVDSEASNGDGALYAWCRIVLENARAAESPLGLSYGIATWDSWSKRLADAYGMPTVLLDCFATAANSGKTPSLEGYKTPHTRKDVCLARAAKTDGEGRRFEALADRLALRGPRGTLVKIDVEGWEWEALEAVPDAELRKVDLLDMQFYPCNFLPPQGKREGEFQRRTALLERLAQFFAATARAPADDRRFRARKDSDLCSGHLQESFSISYVNRARLAELQSG